MLINPIVEARSDCGMTLENLGRRLSLSKQYVSRAEHGTYSGLNKELIKFVAGELQISAREVVRRYEAFQIFTRRRTAADLNPDVLTRGRSIEPGRILFQVWRESYWPSTIRFSNAMCVHPEMVRNYEEAITPSMPEQIRSALLSVNLLDPNWTESPTAPKALSDRVRA